MEPTFKKETAMTSMKLQEEVNDTWICIMLAEACVLSNRITSSALAKAPTSRKRTTKATRRRLHTSPRRLPPIPPKATMLLAHPARPKLVLQPPAEVEVRNSATTTKPRLTQLQSVKRNQTPKRDLVPSAPCPLSLALLLPLNLLSLQAPQRRRSRLSQSPPTATPVSQLSVTLSSMDQTLLHMNHLLDFLPCLGKAAPSYRHAKGSSMGSQSPSY